jgi:hypothetical protein
LLKFLSFFLNFQPLLAEFTMKSMGGREKVWAEEKKSIGRQGEHQLQSKQPANPTPREAASYAAAARRRPQTAPQVRVKPFPSRKDKKRQGFQNAVKSDNAQEILKAIFRQPPQNTALEPTRPPIKEISVIAARINLSKAAQANPKHWIRKALILRDYLNRKNSKGQGSTDRSYPHTGIF